MQSARDAQDFEARTGSKWTDSNGVTKCEQCQAKFTMLNRKHHCRQCGHVVCKCCSPNRIHIGDRKVRVCLSCSGENGSSSRSRPAPIATDIPICLICRNNVQSNSEPLLKYTCRQNTIVFWHKSCAKCCTCGVPKDISQLHVNPPIGSILHTVPGIAVQCYCNDHLSDMEAIQAISPRNGLSTSSMSIESDHKSNSPRKIYYGPSESQYFHLYIPHEAARCGSTAGSPHTSSTHNRSVPLAVILHGGFWKFEYGIDNSAIDTLPGTLLASGMAVCVVEYRRVGAASVDDEGGFPRSNEDVLAALRKVNDVCTEQQSVPLPSRNGSIDETSRNSHLQSHGRKSTHSFRQARVDMSRVVLIGHSAGGYLALWACCCLSEKHLPFTPVLCVAIAPVCDLAEAFNRR